MKIKNYINKNQIILINNNYQKIILIILMKLMILIMNKKIQIAINHMIMKLIIMKILIINIKIQVYHLINIYKNKFINNEYIIFFLFH